MTEEDDVLAMALKDAGQTEEEEGSKPDVGDIESVAELVNRQLDLEDQVVVTEERLKQLNQSLEEIRTKKLPDAMLEMGVSKWVTERDGKRLTVSLDYVVYPSVKKEDMEKFVDWLVERGDEGIVKPKFTVDFEKGDVEAAKKLYKEMQRIHNDLTVSYIPEIHWSTFRSYAKELVKEVDKDDLPSYFKFHEANMAKITTRKI